MAAACAQRRTTHGYVHTQLAAGYAFSLSLPTLPVSIAHVRDVDPSVMPALATYVRSIAIFQPEPAVIAGVPAIFKAHLFFGMTVFLLSPFTHLIHIWSVPFGYLLRAYQVVRRKSVIVR